MDSHGRLLASEATPVDGYGEREAAVRIALALPGAHQKTLVADKGNDAREFVADLRFSGVTPHMAQKAEPRRRSAIDGRTTPHQCYAQSINTRKRIGQVLA